MWFIELITKLQYKRICHFRTFYIWYSVIVDWVKKKPRGPPCPISASSIFWGSWSDSFWIWKEEWKIQLILFILTVMMTLPIMKVRKTKKIKMVVGMLILPFAVLWMILRWYFTINVCCEPDFMKEHTRQVINKQRSGKNKMSPVPALLLRRSPKLPFNTQ